jgi:hypothetical protein
VIVQLHGTGPWGITYINPSDDPRNNKEFMQLPFRPFLPRQSKQQPPGPRATMR